jgi:hypothetical protein
MSYKKIAIGLVLAALFAGCSTLCSIPVLNSIPGVCSASPTPTPAP